MSVLRKAREADPARYDAEYQNAPTPAIFHAYVQEMIKRYGSSAMVRTYGK